MAERQTGSALFYGDAVTATGSTQRYPLGTKRDEEGKTYRYVKYNDGAGDISAVSGRLVGQYDSAATYGEPTSWEVTIDISDSHPDLVTGVLQSAISTGEYGWVLTAGIVSITSNSDGDIIRGDPLVWEASDDTGVVDKAADGTTERIVGVAATTDNSDNPELVYVLVTLE